MNILFLCVANSARSQMAEGIAKKVFGSTARIESAGSQPSRVNPLATEVLKEVGIDITSHYSKPVYELSPHFVEEINFIITLCEEEICPHIISNAKRLHWPLPDPASGQDSSHKNQLSRFRNTRDEIDSRIRAFAEQIKL